MKRNFSEALPEEKFQECPRKKIKDNVGCPIVLGSSSVFQNWYAAMKEDILYNDVNAESFNSLIQQWIDEPPLSPHTYDLVFSDQAFLPSFD